MNSSRIPPGGSVVDLVRAIGLTRSGRSSTSGAERSSTRAESSSVTQHGDALKSKLIQCVQGVDISDVSALRMARRKVVRTILVAEFGEDFIEDAEFNATQESVERAMDSEPEAMHRFIRFIKALTN